MTSRFLKLIMEQLLLVVGCGFFFVIVARFFFLNVISSLFGRWSLLLVLVAPCWLFLALVGCCWSLLVVFGLGWLLLVFIGCCWSFLIVVGLVPVGPSWSLLVVIGCYFSTFLVSVSLMSIFTLQCGSNIRAAEVRPKIYFHTVLALMAEGAVIRGMWQTMVKN